MLTIWSFADYFWRGRHHFGARVSAAVIEVALIVAAYFAGSLPFGYWLVRIFRGADIRTLGSKNTGMTNVWRNFGWRFGVATLAARRRQGRAARVRRAALVGAR